MTQNGSLIYLQLLSVSVIIPVVSFCKNGYKHRDLQPDYVQRVGALGTPSSKWDVAIKSFPQDSGNSAGKEVEKLYEPVKMEDAKKTSILETAKLTHIG